MANARVLDERVLLWRLVLIVVAVAAYLGLALAVSVSGVVSFPIGLAASGILLVAGVLSFLAHGLALGHFNGLWPGLVFVLVFCAFHFASLGDIDAGWYAPELAPFAWLLSVVSLLGWMLGYVFGRGQRSPVAPGGMCGHLGQVQMSQISLRRLGRWGTALFVLGFTVELAIYARVGLGSDWTYLAFKTVVNSQAGIAAVHLLAQMSCIVGTIVAVTCSALREQRLFPSRWFVFVVFAYVLNLAYQGDRSELGVFLFPLFIVRQYLVRPFRATQVMSIAVAALLTVAGVKAFRANNEAQNVATKLQDSSWVFTKTANETGFTLDTLVRSLELVPGRYDYFGGRTYVDALSRVVPNIVLKRENAIVSSVWLTQETSERKSAGKGGLGFSIVAEAYINFGAMGAPILFLLLGLVHGLAERVLTRPKFRVEMFALFMILELGLLVHVRNSAVLYIRGAIWMSCILFALLSCHLLIERMRRRG